MLPFRIYMKVRDMGEKTENKNRPVVDKGLVAMFLRMSPEERLNANDKAVRAILEMRDAYQRQKNKRRCKLSLSDKKTH